MLSGMHVILYSHDADADRAFLRDVLGWGSVESEPGSGWLIFKAPPAEVGVHPTDGPGGAEVHLICEDFQKTVAELRAKGATVREIGEVRWGLAGSLVLPSGLELGIYQPKHALAYDL
jgi:hypothetical protein